MRTKLLSVVAGAGLLVAAAAPALAHHSFAAEFDDTVIKSVRVCGVMPQYIFGGRLQGHTRLVIEDKKLNPVPAFIGLFPTDDTGYFGEPASLGP